MWFIFETGLNIQGVPKTLQFLLHPGDITNYNDSIWYINYIDPHGKLGAAATHRGTHPTPAPGQACLKNPNIMPIQTHPNKITIFVFFGFIVFFLFCIFGKAKKWVRGCAPKAHSRSTVYHGWSDGQGWFVSLTIRCPPVSVGFWAWDTSSWVGCATCASIGDLLQSAALELGINFNQLL